MTLRLQRTMIWTMLNLQMENTRRTDDANDNFPELEMEVQIVPPPSLVIDATVMGREYGDVNGERLYCFSD